MPEKFPIVSWLGKHANVYDTGGTNVYIDCPVCGGRRKLAVSREKLIGRCFRCDDGGHGGKIWNGRAALPKLVSLVAKISIAEAYVEIHKHSGYFDIPAHAEFRHSEVKLPDSIRRCSELRYDHPAIKMLESRDCLHLLDHAFVTDRGQYQGRMILPCRWFGELVGFEAKSFSGHSRKALFPGWFKTGENIYTSKYWDHDLGYAVITESTLDAECVGWNACGLYGCMLRDSQLPRLLELREYGIKKLIWFLDSDARAKELSIITRKTQSLFDNYVVSVPAGEDPCSLGREACLKLISEAKQFRDSLDFVGFENEIRTNRRKPSCPAVPVGVLGN